MTGDFGFPACAALRGGVKRAATPGRGGGMKITCPICRNSTTWEENPYRPFCSERCKLMDMGKWASEEYRIKGKERAAGEEEKPEEKRRG
jgi:endogenous inhibitor of DNA gyrase (YacG/DUF329 family)